MRSSRHLKGEVNRLFILCSLDSVLAGILVLSDALPLKVNNALLFLNGSADAYLGFDAAESLKSLGLYLSDSFVEGVSRANLIYGVAAAAATFLFAR